MCEPHRGLGHMRRAVAFNPDRCRLFGFGFVHRSISGGVDHNVRARRIEARDDSGAVGEVERGPAESDDLNLTFGALDERGRDLALRPGDRDAHHSNSSGAS